jgi:hypothetical protein
MAQTRTPEAPAGHADAARAHLADRDMQDEACGPCLR